MIAGSNISKAKSNESPGENNSSGGGRSPSKNQMRMRDSKLGQWEVQEGMVAPQCPRARANRVTTRS